jgi:hypothetical protein
MNEQTLGQNAAQSYAQGNQMLAEDQSKAQQYTADYGKYQGQADTANQNLQQYTDYIKNAGNPQNLYNTELTKAQGVVGYDPGALGAATQNLIRTQNALNASQQASQNSTGGFGMSGAQLGNYYAQQQAPLSAQLQNQNSSVAGLTNLYQQTLTQGQQGAALGFQGEQLTSQNLAQIFTNAKDQAAQALSNMQFYSQLASSQGGLNAQQQQYYATAVSSLKSAQAAMIQANAAAQKASAESAQINQSVALAKQIADTYGGAKGAAAALGYNQDVLPTSPITKDTAAGTAFVGASASNNSPSILDRIKNGIGNML